MGAVIGVLLFTYVMSIPFAWMHIMMMEGRPEPEEALKWAFVWPLIVVFRIRGWFLSVVFRIKIRLRR